LREADDAEYFGHIAGCLDVVAEYSTDIAAAWQVVEKLRSDGFEVELEGDSTGWHCLFLDYPEAGRAEAQSPPLAICLAALEAAGVICVPEGESITLGDRAVLENVTIIGVGVGDD